MKLIRLKFKGKNYAYDEKTRLVYDLELAQHRIFKKIGELTPFRPGRPQLFIRESFNDSPSQFYKSKAIFLKKLDKINKKKLNKYLEYTYAPGGPGYEEAKKSFKKNAKTQKKHSRARSSLGLGTI